MRIECVPNFSTGPGQPAIDRIAASLQGVDLLDVSSDPDHNRTVFTFTGPPAAVEQSAIAAARAAIDTIDLRHHTGVHPRIGSIDVIPFIPISNVTMDHCAALAARVARALWDRLSLPSFFYEFAHPARRPLEELRRLALAGSPPDTGLGRHPTAGAAAIGARNFLVAWNILLASTDLALAKRIARSIRQSSGGYPGVKALGLPLAHRDCVQVSINSVDFTATPLPVIFEAVSQQAQAAGVPVLGAELIGLIPQPALSGPQIPWLNLTPPRILPF